MCLYTLRKKPFVAGEDITCYKLICNLTEGLHNPIYETPYRHIGIRIPGTLQACSKGDAVFEEISSLYVVEGQGVHAFLDLKTAYSYALRDKLIVARCTIPAGTEYWLEDLMNSCEIAARQMKIEEII